MHGIEPDAAKRDARVRELLSRVRAATRASPTAIRTNSPAASASASASPARWRWSRSSSSATSRFGARRVDPGAGDQPAGGSARAVRPDLSVHRARSVGGAAYLPPRRGDVSRPHRRDWPTADELFGNPLHPYTQALLAAVPVPDPTVEQGRDFQPVQGEVPSPINPPSGCVFHPRCPIAVRSAAAARGRNCASCGQGISSRAAKCMSDVDRTSVEAQGKVERRHARCIASADDSWLLASWRLACVRVVPGARADDTPKRGGTLTYMIPADAPPSLDGHRETTYATVHAVAPFYSVLIRVNPENPVVTDRFRLRSLHRDADADRRRQDLHLQDPRRREVP